MNEIDFDVAYRSDIKPYTGKWSEKLERVKCRLSGLTREYNSMWIGIAREGNVGLRQRWERKYKGLGLTQIAAVYLTESDSFLEEMEGDLTDYLTAHMDKEIVEAGPTARRPPYIVYVAWN